MHVLVTGASKGIGEAIARHYAAAGCDLTIVARSHDKLDALAAELNKAHRVRMFVRPADLSRPEVCDELLEDAVDALGPVDILVNNAAVQYVEEARGVSDERAALIINLDLTTPIRLMNGVLSTMLERGTGGIVNVSSMAAVSPTTGMAHYNAVKSGLAAYSETLRVELRGTGVHVLTVYPGPVESDLEAAARAAYVPNIQEKLLPTGKPHILAARIDRALEKKRARLYYPASYALTHWISPIATWFSLTLSPELRERE